MHGQTRTFMLFLTLFKKQIRAKDHYTKEKVVAVSKFYDSSRKNNFNESNNLTVFLKITDNKLKYMLICKI